MVSGVDMSIEEVLICPACRVALNGRKCPACGAELDKSDWPCVKGIGREYLFPYFATNLMPPSDGRREYDLRPCQMAAKGSLKTPFPYKFPYGNSCICIGGSKMESDVYIDGADHLHLALLKNQRTKAWWVYDCGSSSGTYVNKERVHCKSLQSGDKISVVGVDLTFRGDRLESSDVFSDGMSLSVENMCFEIKNRRILDNITFSVAKGEFIGILGPSGCGKSSLIQRLVGLSNEFSGEIFVNGYRKEDCENSFRAATAYLPQNVDETLHDTLTLASEIDCFRRIHLIKSQNEHQENEECLKALGINLEEKGSSRIGSLSGGEKRRVGIALALLRCPQLLLLDEPGAGLDPASERSLMEHLHGIAKQGRTVLCVTHVLSNFTMFDKLLVLSKGQIVYFDKPANLFESLGIKANDFGRLYQMLVEGVAPKCYEPAPKDRTQSEFLEVEQPSLVRRMGGYIKRMYKEFFSDRKSSNNYIAKLFSVPAVYFLWQPLGLVAGIRIACACYFRTIGGKAIDVELLGFCAALSMFWIGINNAAREIVKERVPGRCLERLNQVPLAPYLLSKFAWTVGICAAQTLSFTVLLCVTARLPIQLVAHVNSPFLELSWLWFVPLFVSCLMGAACGLAVSSIAKKSLAAISIVPNIAILALLFSNAMVRFENNNDYYAPVAKTLSTTIMPCYWPSKVLSAIQEGVNDGAALFCLLSLFLMYIVVSVVFVWIFQEKNEKAWNGR